MRVESRISDEKMKVSCIILAGGRSTRMGRDKKFIFFRGRPLIEHSLEVARKLSDEVVVSLGSRRQVTELTAEGISGVSFAFDHLPARGPLVGLYSALRECTRDYAVVMPCDSPTLDTKFFRSLVASAEGYDGAVPRVGKLIEPLHAVYKVKPMLKACGEAIESGAWDVRGVVKKLRIKYIDARTTSFLNVNTPEDLRKLLRGGGHGR